MKNSESNIVKSFVKSIFSILVWKTVVNKEDINDKLLTKMKFISSIHSVKVKDIITKYNDNLDKVNSSNNFTAITYYNKAFYKIESLENPESTNQFIKDIYYANFYIDEAIEIVEGKR